MSVPIFMLLGRLMMFKDSARISANLPLINLLAIIGLGMALRAFFYQHADIVVPALAIAGWNGLLL